MLLFCEVRVTGRLNVSLEARTVCVGTVRTPLSIAPQTRVGLTVALSTVSPPRAYLLPSLSLLSLNDEPPRHLLWAEQPCTIDLVKHPNGDEVGVLIMNIFYAV